VATVAIVVAQAYVIVALFFLVFYFLFFKFIASFVAAILAGGHISLCSIKPKRRQRD